MKKLLLLFIAVSFTLLANAQFGVDANANWQQQIPTILGGNCVSISNVSYTAPASSAGLFTNFPGFGNGILLTTGTATGINTDATNFITADNMAAGNALLDQELNITTQDASSLKFDFTVSQSGLVTVDYIFASEEYPEFVNAGFNDAFGFFVSAPGLPTQNIALVPGTQTPVSIDNISDATNSSFYVDNSNGLVVAYDGYTVPLTAEFFADSGIVYTLTVVIADVGDNSYDSGVFLRTYASNSQPVTGTIYHQGQPAQGGFAELFGYNTNETAAPLIDVQPISNGTYTFPNVASGAYNVRVTLDTLLHPNTYPTYFDSAFTWNDATIISAPCNNYNLDMQLLVLNNGDGIISGTIGQSGEIFKSKAEGVPYVGAHVYLASPANIVYGFELTNTEGFFRFTNIPDGVYNIIVDAPGLLMDSVRTVNINPANKVYTNQSYLVGANKIIVEESPLNTAEESVFTGVLMYPNPATNSINLSFNLSNNSTITADIIGLAGKVVSTIYSGQMAKGTQQLFTDTQALAQGMYFLRLTANNSPVYIQKLIKN
jgi:Secretion system C-terminal sorting domain